MRILLGGVALCIVCGVTFLFFRRAWTRYGETRRSLAAVSTLAYVMTSVAFIGEYLPDTLRATLVASTIPLLGAFWLRRTLVVPSASYLASVDEGAPPRWSIVIAILGAVLVVWTTLGTHLWDETNGHYGLTGAIARGVFPPVHPLFPDEPFRYHVGFDVLAGIVSAFTGVGFDHAIDVVTIVCYGLLLWTAHDVGRALGGARGAGWAMVLVPLGSGALQVFLQTDFYYLELRTSLFPESWRQNMPPPVISNFFQHPQGLGMSLSLAVLLAFSDAQDRPTAKRAVGAWLLGCLSYAQAIYFLVLGFALLIVAAMRALRERNVRGLMTDGALLLGSLAMAFLLGGMFRPSGTNFGVLLWGKTASFEPWLSAIAHHIVIFGAPLLVFFPALVWRSRRAPELFVSTVLIAVVGFVVPNVVTYERSWDIVKFYGVGAFFLNVAMVAFLSAFARMARVICVAVVFLSVVASGHWLLRMSVFNGVGTMHPMQFGPAPRIGMLVAEALDDDRRARVFATDPGVAMGGGILTPGYSWQEYGSSYLLDRQKAEKLSLHLTRARLDLGATDLAALGVRYLVLSEEDRSRLSETGRARLLDPTLFGYVGDVEFDRDRRTIVRVLEPALRPTP